MKNKFEKLILLEFMVNKVVYYEHEYNIDKVFLSQLGETYVQIKFKGTFLVEIKEDENSLTDCDEKGNKVVHMGCGKSCLLSVNQLLNNTNCEASVCVSRKTPDGEPKEFFTLGDTKVNLEPVFKVLQSNTKCGPAIKSMKGEYDLRDGQCNKIGTIELFVRATGLGKNVVTMFQLGAGESSFYFKGTEQLSEDDDEEEEDSSSFVCKQSKQDFGEPCAQAPSRHVRPEPSMRAPGPCDPFFPYKEGMTYNQPLPQGGGGGWPPTQGFGAPQQGGFPSAQPFGASGMPGMGMGMGMGVPGALPGQQFMQPQGGAYPQQLYRDEDYEKLDGEYKEISAEVNGYEVKIKLLRRPKKVNT